jgi:pyruvate kinase
MRLRRCKIVATLGPASANPATIAALFHAGADLFRINMSHATHDQMRGQAGMIRALQEECGRPIGILLDLQGPKPRIGTFKDRAVQLVKGARFVFDLDPAPGAQNRVGLPHPEILRSLKPGHAILIADGKVRLHVAEASTARAVAIVDVAGEISNRKGVSLPDTEIPVSSFTEKDRADLKAGLDAGMDWVAVSFVRRPDDVAEVKKLTLGRALVMAKLEKPQATTHLDEIVEISDALMVARGDLGVEMPLEKVPGLQKRINRMARLSGKPVVVATQMLESMITNPVPTRAEVSDVATAIFEGAEVPASLEVPTPPAGVN